MLLLSRLNSDRKGSQSRRACRLKEISCCCGSRAADPRTPQLRGSACRLCDPCMGRLRNVRSEGTVSCEPAPRGHIENSVHENFQEKMFGPFRSFQPQAESGGCVVLSGHLDSTPAFFAAGWLPEPEY
jgi:hypothetical protein